MAIMVAFSTGCSDGVLNNLSSNNGSNSENPGDTGNGGGEEGGGYFREVFTESTTALASTNESISKGNFNEMMTEVFKNQKGVVSIGTITSGPHAITAWGISYDDEGYINGIYTSDPAYNGKTIEENVWGGLDYDKVIYSSSGKPYIQNKAGSTFPINGVYILYQNAERW